MVNITQRAFVESMAHHAGRFIATCKTNEQRDAALGLLEVYKTQLFLKDRYFSIERFDNRVLAVEEQFRKALKDGWTGEPVHFEGVFNVSARRPKAKAKRIAKATGNGRRKGHK